jgi:hypothetical protein
MARLSERHEPSIWCNGIRMRATHNAWAGIRGVHSHAMASSALAPGCLDTRSLAQACTVLELCDLIRRVPERFTLPDECQCAQVPAAHSLSSRTRPNCLLTRCVRRRGVRPVHRVGGSLPSSSLPPSSLKMASGWCAMCSLQRPRRRKPCQRRSWSRRSQQQHRTLRVLARQTPSWSPRAQVGFAMSCGYCQHPLSKRRVTAHLTWSIGAPSLRWRSVHCTLCPVWQSGDTAPSAQARLPEPTTVLFVGDLHGSIHSLAVRGSAQHRAPTERGSAHQRVLRMWLGDGRLGEDFGLTAGHALVFMGDYVDRGEASLAVLVSRRRRRRHALTPGDGRSSVWRACARRIVVAALHCEVTTSRCCSTTSSARVRSCVACSASRRDDVDTGPPHTGTLRVLPAARSDATVQLSKSLRSFIATMPTVQLPRVSRSADGWFRC